MAIYGRKKYFVLVVIAPKEKRYPNLIDELGHYINVTQVERDMQMGDGQLELDIDG